MPARRLRTARSDLLISPSESRRPVKTECSGNVFAERGALGLREKDTTDAVAGMPRRGDGINNRIAVQRGAGTGYCIHGRLPGFQREEKDVRNFRMFTSQMIINGTVRLAEIVRAFEVPKIAVKRYGKLFRDQGGAGFHEAKPRHSLAPVLKKEVLEQAR